MGNHKQNIGSKGEYDPKAKYSKAELQDIILMYQDYVKELKKEVHVLKMQQTKTIEVIPRDERDYVNFCVIERLTRDNVTRKEDRYYLGDREQIYCYHFVGIVRNGKVHCKRLYPEDPVVLHRRKTQRSIFEIAYFSAELRDITMFTKFYVYRPKCEMHVAHWDGCYYRASRYSFCDQDILGISEPKE